MGPNARKTLKKRAWLFSALAGLALAPFLAVYGLGLWIDCSDVPEKSDYIVVLAGGYARPLYAADLYKSGYAPEIWLSRPAREPSESLLEKYGIRLPREEETNRAILLRRGVPLKHIHFYAQDAQSTANEALAFNLAVSARGKKILIVTSRFHARRARMIFRRALAGASIQVVATPYERFTRRWWTDKGLATQTILEIFKMAYYLLGVKFLSPLEAPKP